MTKFFEIRVSDNAGLASSTLLQRAQDFLDEHAKTCSIVYTDEQQCDYAARSIAREFYARLDAAVKLHEIGQFTDDELPAFICDECPGAGNCSVVVDAADCESTEIVALAYQSMINLIQAGGNCADMNRAVAEQTAKNLDRDFYHLLCGWADDHHLSDDEFASLKLPKFAVSEKIDWDNVTLIPSAD